MKKFTVPFALFILLAVSLVGVFATENSSKKVVISWEPSLAEDLKCYQVYRKVDSEDFRLIGMTESIKFLDTNVDINTTYTYTVTALDTSFNESTRSLAVHFVNSDNIAPATIRVTGAHVQNDVYVGISVTKP